MAYDGIVTKSIVHELCSIILNGKINKVLQPNKNEINLGIYNSGKNYLLNFCIESNNCKVCLTTHPQPNPKNAYNFCMFLRKHIIGYKIKNIYTIDLERVIFIDLEGYNEFNDLTEKKLIIEIMGKHSNIILCNNDNVIMDSMRHLDIISNSNRDIMPARKYVMPKNNKISFINLNNFEEFYNIIKNTSNSLDKAICSSFTGFSMNFVQNVLKEKNIKNNCISKDSLKILYSYFKNILNNINNVNGKLTENDYSIFIEENKNLLDFNYFIDNFYYNKITKEKFISFRNSILKQILTYFKKYQVRLKNINSKLNECKNKDIYKIYGELLTANLYKLKDIKEDSVSLLNYYDNNNLIKIPLDKKYSVAINAKRYFKKYNKLKNAKIICTKQQEETKLELDYIESIVYELETATNIDDLNIIYNEISESSIFKNLFKTNNSQKSKISHKSSLDPIEYNIDGYTVYVGKNNISNDNLTTKLASKTDLWFHTKDIHGSHVVLQLKGNQPSEDIIVKCAQIAAYHSKAKLSTNVPVDYCYIKYVKKPNKSKAGMVIYTHNKTINVNPKDY